MGNRSIASKHEWMAGILKLKLLLSDLPLSFLTSSPITPGAPRRRFCAVTGSLFVTLCATLLLSPSYAAAPRGNAESGDQAILTDLEKRLFFKTYQDDAQNVRLERLEKQVFGSSRQGDLHERLSSVQQALGPQVNPDGTITGATAPPQAQPVESTPPQPQKPVIEDPQSAAERARLAVQAAKEEELNRLLAEGVQLFRNKRSKEAQDKFAQVIRLDPNNVQANFSLGIIYEAAGKLSEACACYKRAQAQRPDDSEYHDAVEAIQKKMSARGKIDEKQGEIAQLASEAAAAYKRGEYMSALDLYKQLDEKAPNQALVKYNLGTLYLATQNPYRALEYYQQARKLKPSESRYVTAYEQLEQSLRKSDNERMQAENAWAEAEGGSGPGSEKAGKHKHKKEKEPRSDTSNEGGSTHNDPLSSYGIEARSSHDGVVITAIGLSSRASRVGLAKGDIIKAVDGTVVKRTDELNEILSRKGGGSVTFMIQRAQQLGSVSL